MGLLLAPLASLAQAPVTQTQSIPLYTGWNLISLQVSSNGFAPATLRSSLFGTGGTAVPAALQSIWSYDAASRQWISYQPAIPNYPNDLTNVAPGRGYWVEMAQNATLTLSGVPWSGAVTLLPGWNLVGFGGLAPGASDSLSLAAVLRDQQSRTPQIWAFDTPSSSFLGYDAAALPPLTNLTTLEPGRGYWVNSLNTLSFTPVPDLLLPGDIDLPPLQEAQTNGLRSAGPEDIAGGTDLNGNGLLDDALRQDTLLFKEGINQQLITIANSGYGVIDWFATESIPWLALDGGDTVQGVTATEFDYITVTVNRAGLLPGTHTNSFQLSAGRTTRTIRIILKVPAIDGDWRGHAATTRVNGQPISIGKVDLNLTLYSKTTNAANRDIQAVINRELSLLFPRDVFMAGTFYQDNDFFLTTNFEVPTGDRNNPPFSVFSDGNSGGNPNWSRDIDLNRDGKLDNANPFPFALRREITLFGRRVNENQLIGSYYESIQGVLPGSQRINIEGDFQLDRTSLTPSLTSIYNRYAPTNLIIGASSPTALTNIITVTPSVTVQGVVVTVNLDFALGSGVTLTLVAPGTNGTSVLLDTAGFSGSRTYTLSAFNGLSGQGAWKLIVRWTPNGERGSFRGWQLNVQGLAAYTASGTIVTDLGDNPVDGARVTLTGNNFVGQQFTPANGTFSFADLTENDFTLTVSKVGYQDATASFSIISSNVALGSIRLQPVTNTAPQLLTAPEVGGEPLTVNFRTLIPLTILSNLGTIRSNAWFFGDGAVVHLPGTIVPELEHAYLKPGAYFATNRIYGATSNLSLRSSRVIVLPSSVPAGSTHPAFISGASFLGSMGSSVEPGLNSVEPLTIGFTNVSIVVNGETIVLSNVPSAIVFQESKRDTAGFDLNRDFSAYTNILSATNRTLAQPDSYPGKEDTDFFGQPGTPWALVNTDTIDSRFDAFPRLATVNNATNRFRMAVTLGGHVFGPERQPPEQAFRIGTNTLYGCEPAKVGILVLQPSRIEP